MANEEQKPMVVVTTATKSMGLSIILTVLFGPLGMFYSSVTGAIIMLVISIIVGALTFGLGLLLTWPISIIWGARATSAYNKNLIAGVKQY